MTKEGLPQSYQVKEKTNGHQREQQGADMRADSIGGTEPVYLKAWSGSDEDHSTAGPVGAPPPSGCGPTYNHIQLTS